MFYSDHDCVLPRTMDEPVYKLWSGLRSKLISKADRSVSDIIYFILFLFLHWDGSKPSVMSAVKLLSPGQTDSQVVASSHKLNLGRELRWVAKRTRKFPRKFPRKYTKVAKKPFQGRNILYFIGW